MDAQPKAPQARLQSLTRVERQGVKINAIALTPRAWSSARSSPAAAVGVRRPGAALTYECDVAVMLNSHAVCLGGDDPDLVVFTVEKNWTGPADVDWALTFLIKRRSCLVRAGVI